MPPASAGPPYFKPTVLLAVAAALLAMLCASPAGAHLQLYRQGPESADTPESGDLFGSAVASGDFNGDGYDDVAAGAPFEDIGAIADAGIVIINWGSHFGITHVGAHVFTQSTAGGAIHPGSEFGAALVAADFDHDGYDDLAIGAPGSSLGLTNKDRGEVLVLRGTSSGLVPWLWINEVSAGLTADPGDRFGQSLVAGNFDLDVDDRLELIVGAPGENNQQGIIVEFIGGVSGPGSGGTAWFDEAVLGGANVDGNQFGFSLAAGNLMGTAAPDLAVGVPGFDVISTFAIPDIGRVWVIPGIVGAGISQVNATPYDASDVDNAQQGARFGYALAAGVFQDAGGYASLAVGEPYRSVSGYTNQGRVTVWSGANGGLVTAAATVLDASYFNDAFFDNELFGSALAAGSFHTADAWDDLAIGGYNESNQPGPIQAGHVFMAYGSTTGFDGSTAAVFWDQYDLNEQPAVGDKLGWTLAFGAFDATGNGGLAVGAPGETADGAPNEGAVYIVAPWRQEYGLGCYRALTVDCEDNWVYSLKPFERSCIASITKIMTVMIATERMQLPSNDPRYFDPNGDYVAGAWVSTWVPGSKYHFGLNERMKHIDMLYACLMRSGNDAAFAIADAIYGPGDPTVTVPMFVAEMNARAAALGMTETHFHNPAGLDNEPFGPDLGEHYSTLNDYLKLCRAAMNNPMFAEIAGTKAHPITRHLILGNTPVDVPWTIYNIFNVVLNNMNPPMNGIKGGSTTCAQATGMFSGPDPGGAGLALVGTFYTPFTISDDVYTPDAARLMNHGIAECGTPVIIDPGVPSHIVRLPVLRTDTGLRLGGSFEVPDRHTGDRTLSAFRVDSGSDDAHSMVHVSRFSELMLGPGESVDLGTMPFQKHAGIFFTNMNQDVVQFTVTTSYDGGGDFNFELMPNERDSIPAFDDGTERGDATMTVTNMTPGTDISLSVDEFYMMNVTHPPGPGPWSMEIKRNGTIVNDGFHVMAEGMDPADQGGDVAVVMSRSGTPVAVQPARPVIPGGSLVQLRPARPNPFSGQTTLAFDLATRGRVGLEVFDVRGRRVRAYRAVHLEPGRWSFIWNGRDANGRQVSGGVYFYRVLLGGRAAASGKVMVVR